MKIKNCKIFRKIYTNSVGIDFVFIPAGSFIMGIKNGFLNESFIRSVTIHKPFFISKFPITQKQWETLMGYNPSYFTGDNLPVESINWYETQEFIKKLNQTENTNKYRLPFEAEWEYSCKAGTNTKWFFGTNKELLDLYAWYRLNSNNKTHPVGLKRPNPWGLYDMYGNVWEWCNDVFNELTSHSFIDDIEPDAEKLGSKLFYVIKGSCYRSRSKRIYSAAKSYENPICKDNFLGFRLVKTL